MSLKSKILLASVFVGVAALVGLHSSDNNASGTRDTELRPDNGGAIAHAQPLLRGKQRVDVHALTAQLPLSFEQNIGQLDATAMFASRGAAYDLFLTSTGTVLELRNSRSGLRDKVESESPPKSKKSDDPLRSVLTLELQGANRNATASGVDELPGRRNYFIGSDPKKWRTDVKTFRAVRYDEIYPGISLTYYGNQQQLEYDFEVGVGADPQTIRLSFNSGVHPRISPTGDLLLRTTGGEVCQQRPVIYQEVDGHRQLVDGHYVLHSKRQVGFEVRSYDRNRPLVIDPTLVYSTYIGGSGDDLGSSIAVDSNNNVYVAGTTSSINFPLHNGAYPANAGLADIFVTKIDAAGANIVYSTYVGGSGLDRGDGIAVDSGGNAYVVGRVDSSSTKFPTTPGSFATGYRGGDFDGVVFKLNSQGSSLVYSTFLGGEENDSTEGVVVDSDGNAYVTGGTKSTGFPTTLNAYQGNRGGDTDAYLTKINPTGSALLYSTYLGGSGTDRGSGVAIDNNGNAYVAGFAGSPDFPTENPFQSGFGGGFDAFVAQIDTKLSGLNSLVLCSYLGGAGDDKAYGIAIDSGANNIFVVGQTSSNNFPVLNPVQPASGGSFDAFIAKISVSGTKVYASYLGGSGDDRGTGIAVNSSGAAYVTGFTASTNFPTASPLQSSKSGGSDAFVLKLNAAGSSFLYSTYLGGSGNENSVSTVNATNPIALDSSNNAYITGYTASNDFPITAPLQGTNAGGASDAFVAKISDVTPAADFSVSASPPTQTVNPGNDTTFTVTVTPVSGFTGTVALGVTGLSGGANGSFLPASVVIADAGAQTSTLTITTTGTTPPGTYPLTITTSSGTLQHNTSASLIVPGATSANLSITKTASPNPAIVSSNLTYRIIVSNAGPSPATNVTVSDPLPAGVSFVSATPTQGTCNGTTTVACNLGTIATGTSATVTIICVPQSTGDLSNTAIVGATENDPNLSDNSATVITEVNTQSSGPSMLDPRLSVHSVVGGLSQPTSMAFIGPNDFFVLEKDTGKVKRILNGAVQSTVLDLAVNSASERGLLGIALHPDFKNNGYVYLYWTESSTGIDSTNLADVALLGNRLDRYVWNGTGLTFDRNLIKLHAYQADANQPLRGNHNGGVLRFGPDGKIYLIMGDNGRRGLLQNVTNGQVPDDQFGGPEPDNNHLTGIILRLNDDGSTPSDNPFFNASTSLTGEAAANIKKLYGYGVRNSFGMAFDPLSGNLWTEENGDDCCDELNRVVPGFNGGWVQIIGPLSRLADYKQIETTYGTKDLQQLRWSPTLIADTQLDAMSRLFMLPGAVYKDPEFSWKYAVAPAAIGFMLGRGLGPQFEGDLFVGGSRTFLSGGYLFRFKLSVDRQNLSFDDPRLLDRVADNLDKFDITESESLLVGKDFGVTTDIETGPNGNLFVVSNTNAAVYEISGTQPTLFVANLNSAQEVPSNSSTAAGTATLLLSPDETSALVSLNFTGLSSSETVAHVHGPAIPGVNAPVLFPVPEGNFSDYLIQLSASDVQNLKAGLFYINVHSNTFPGGEIRGQFQTSPAASSFQFNSANYSASEGSGSATIAVTRLGNTSAAATIDYATSDGTASNRTDYITSSGTLQFAVGETLKTFTVPLVDDVYVEGSQNINLILTNPSVGTFLGSPSSALLTVTDNDTSPPITNPLDDAQFFVRQHYLDFLNREPDQGGLGFWTNEITKCGADATCINRRRVDVSAAFFTSDEFQQTGSYVYRLYKGALGRQPTYAEFTLDRSKVVAGANLEATKDSLVNEFVLRNEFTQLYPASLSNSQFVNRLFDTAGLTPFAAERQQQIDAMGTGKTRAQVVRAVVEIQAFKDREVNPSFVLMQYFGYLRRDPEPGGYLFWLNILNNLEPNNYRGMVCAFITSTEYQQRISSVITHNNSDCAGL